MLKSVQSLQDFCSNSGLTVRRGDYSDDRICLVGIAVVAIHQRFAGKKDYNDKFITAID